MTGPDPRFTRTHPDLSKLSYLDDPIWMARQSRIKYEIRSLIDKLRHNQYSYDEIKQAIDSVRAETSDKP